MYYELTYCSLKLLYRSDKYIKCLFISSLNQKTIARCESCNLFVKLYNDYII